MTLHQDFLPCTQDKAPTLTLIHGWGAENSVWMDWAQQLSNKVNVCLIELPGFGQSPTLDDLENGKELEAWLQALGNALPEKSHLLGWSLGGLLAQQLALRYSDQVQSLICLASTPRFVQNDGWQWAVSPPLLGDFIKALGIEYGSVLKQFWRLQLQGSDNARPLMKKLANHMSERTLPSYNGLLQGLHLLRDMDNREAILDISQPTLWLLGEHDPLIPKELIQDLSQLQPHGQTHIIEGAAHMPFFSHPDETAQQVLSFISGNAE